MIGQNVPPGSPQSNEEELKKRQQQGAITGAVPQNRGTGFTNVQQYLQASAPAAKGVAAKVGSMVSGQQKASEKAVSEAEQVRQGAQAAQAKTQGAAGVAGAIQQIGAGQGDITELEKQAKDAAYFTSGQYAAEQQKLKQQALEKQAAAQGAVSQLGKTAEQLQSEAGQAGILSKLYKAPTYGAGQQRLDQLLLQGAAGGQLGGLQSNLAKTLGTQQKTLGTSKSLTAQALQDIGSLGAAGQASIQSALLSGQQALGKAQEVEAATRTATSEAQRNELQNALVEAAIASKGGDVVIEQDIADKYKQATGMDITESPIFNVLGGQDIEKNTGAQQKIRDILSSQMLKAKDVVTADDLRRMQTLEKLGAGKSAFAEAAGPLPEYGVTSTLRSAQEDAFKKFLEASKKDITGRGQRNWESWDDLGLTSDTRTEAATKSANVYNMISKALGVETDPTTGEIVYKPIKGESYGEADALIKTGQGIENPFDPFGDVLERVARLAYGVGVDMPIALTNQVLKMVGYDPAGGREKARAKAYEAAQRDAVANLESNIQKFLKDQGFGRKIKIGKPDGSGEVK